MSKRSMVSNFTYRVTKKTEIIVNVDATVCRVLVFVEGSSRRKITRY